MGHRSVARLVRATAAVALILGPGRAAAEELAAPPPKTERTVGEAGDVVLQDIIGVRTSTIPNFAPYAATPPGTDGVGLFEDPGPSVSAAWLELWTSNASFDRRPPLRVSTTLRFEPSADVFVARRISVGASIGVALGSFRNPGAGRAIEAVSVSVDPRIGYLLPLGGPFALWPRARAGITVDPTNGELDSRGFRVGADAPLVVAVSSHVLLSCGPELTYASYDRGSLTRADSLHLAGRGGMSISF